MHTLSEKARALGVLADFLSITEGLSIAEANDILQEIKWTIADVNDDTIMTEYQNAEEVLQDFIGLDKRYLWLFE